MIKNIEDKFLRAELDCFIDSDWGRIYLITDNQSTGLKLLKTVFGISSISPVLNYTDDLDEITKATVDYAKNHLHAGQSFALRTRRIGQHQYTSQDIAKHVGGAILSELKSLNLTVNLSSPDVEIFIEVRRKNSYIFLEIHPGPGGLPLSTQGKVISIFNDEYSYVATWLMMKRGCRAYPVYFKSSVETIEDPSEQMLAQVETLKAWALNIKLKVFEINGLSNKNSFNVLLNNKELLNYIKRVNAKGICMSGDLKSFSRNDLGGKYSLPIFYPLIGLDRNRIQDLAKMIMNI